jgi:predicted AlkP superfamily pyrophosphatase or phosphodiesterase
MASARDPRYVVAISVDGLNADALTVLGKERAPAMSRMRAEGASTLNARTAYERTETLPNHTGMLTGRRVGGDRGHHVGFNYDNHGNVHTTAGRYVASLFDVVHDRGGRTAFYSTKEKFAFFNRSWGPNRGAPDRTGADDGRDKIDRYLLGTPGDHTTRLVRRLQRNPDEVSFLHIARPDVVGHERGFMGPRYLEAVERADRWVGRILGAVDADPFLRSHVNVVLTADHGGAPGAHGHFDAGAIANYRIPFLVWGADVAAGRNLYALNPERTNPRERRPHYRAAPPIRNTDLASLVTTLLGQGAVPGGRLPGTRPLHVS